MKTIFLVIFIYSFFYFGRLNIVAASSMEINDFTQSVFILDSIEKINYSSTLGTYTTKQYFKYNSDLSLQSDSSTITDLVGVEYGVNLSFSEFMKGYIIRYYDSFGNDTMRIERYTHCCNGAPYWKNSKYSYNNKNLLVLETDSSIYGNGDFDIVASQYDTIFHYYDFYNRDTLKIYSRIKYINYKIDTLIKYKVRMYFGDDNYDTLRITSFLDSIIEDRYRISYILYPNDTTKIFLTSHSTSPTTFPIDWKINDKKRYVYNNYGQLIKFYSNWQNDSYYNNSATFYYEHNQLKSEIDSIISRKIDETLDTLISIKNFYYRKLEVNKVNFYSESNPIIFPNPVFEQLHLKCVFPIRMIQLFDLNGKEILTKHLNDINCIVNIKNINSGIYFLKLQTDKKVYNQKIIKQ